MKYAKKFSSSEDYVTWRTSSDYQIPSVVYCPEESFIVYHKFPVANEYDYVDLALPSGTLWATMNIGASEVGEVGDYFAWGETSTKSNFTWGTYAFGTSDNLTKYNASDGKRTLDLEDDAAHVLWGGSWHIPSPAQIEELAYYTQYAANVLIELPSYRGYIADNGEVMWLWEGGETIGEMDGTSIAGLTRYWYEFLSNKLVDGSYTHPQILDDEGEGYGIINYQPTSSGYRYRGFQIRPVIGTLDVFNYPEVAKL